MDQGIHKLAPVKDDSTQTVSSDPERNSFAKFTIKSISMDMGLTGKK